MSCSCFKHSLIIFFNQATKNGEDFGHSKQLFGATTLRNVLGTKTLAEILSEGFLELIKIITILSLVRELIAHWMRNTLDEAMDPWGVKVERVEM